MMKRLLIMISLSLLVVTLAWAGDDHGHHNDHGEHNDHEEHHDDHEKNHVEIDQGIATKSSIKTTDAKSRVLQQTIKAYGELVLAPDQVANIAARFPGVVTDVKVNIGDEVEKGDLLAQVESDESLQSYALRTPIAGVVQHRHANVGEVTGDRSLFRIANWDTLWAEIKVFPRQRSQVQTGQWVTVTGNNYSQKGRIAHLLPTSNHEAFVVARVPIGNDNGAFIPGDMVEASIAVAQIEVPLAVANRALQTVRDQTVVFVQEGDRYELRPLELGRADGEYTEVLAGLQVGDRYVVENSYLIKGELEKSGAAHHHH